jgi:ABC-2 type transport system ATP-binding protein
MSPPSAYPDPEVAFAPAASPAPAAGPTPPILVCEGLTKRFPVARTWSQAVRRPLQRTFADSVREVSFAVAPGEFFGLLGPNGAGKTTLFKLLSTAILPDGGTATVAGFDVVRQASEVRRRLTPVLANERSLNWRLSGRENLNLFAALYGLHGAAARARIDEVLAAVDLSDVGEKMVANFSSGMKQRLSIARALISDPKILLLDEPTRSLDPVSARNFRAFLREDIAGRRGCTVLLATHSSDEALGLCDRVAVLNKGRLLATGTPDDLLRRFGDERYRLWTTAPAHPVFSSLAAEGIAASWDPAEPAEEGWSRLELHLRGGLPRASAVLERLVRAGVPIARFEHVALSLGDLIDRVVGGSAAQERAP